MSTFFLEERYVSLIPLHVRLFVSEEENVTRNSIVKCCYSFLTKKIGIDNGLDLINTQIQAQKNYAVFKRCNCYNDMIICIFFYSIRKEKEIINALERRVGLLVCHCQGYYSWGAVVIISFQRLNYQSQEPMEPICPSPLGTLA